ncbi:MAG: tRNA (adenosine(37)-N6)-threonylcarbamoyltransferase complex transferase subunit TsaD [Methylophilaceae bacterium]
MLILGIESSCDETGLALYDSASGLIGHVLNSQVDLHRLYGGVVPELASRDHIRFILPLLDELFKKTNKDVTDLNAIAYTKGPGLSGALLVGASVAESLAMSLDIPTIPIHHLEGHLLSPFLENNQPEFPFLALLVSGGHSQLIHVRELGEYEIIGDTLDDAAGEAFDKSAQLLGLGYPGGAALSKLASTGSAFYSLPKPLINSDDLNFSFSGLKTAVLNLVKKEQPLDDIKKANIAYAFQESITDVLTTKCLKALKEKNLSCLVVSGGVGANRQLRDKLKLLAQEHSFQLFFPSLEFCTDNGAMIAIAGFFRHQLSQNKNYEFAVKPKWKLTEI